MIDGRYLKYLLFAVVACGLSYTYMWFSGVILDITVLLICFIASVALTSLVVVRLPGFRQYYRARSYAERRKYRGYVAYKSVPVLVGLVSGVCLGGCLYAVGVERPLGSALVGGVAAIVISLYHERT